MLNQIAPLPLQDPTLFRQANYLDGKWAEADNGQTITVNNNIFFSNGNVLYGQATGDITEDYNCFWNNATDRTNTAVGAHSVNYPPLDDPRWFFQLIYAGAGPNSALQMLSPFDLASFSQLIDLAGTSPTATDMRSTGTIGAQREWGPLEYDSTLNIQNNFRGSAANIGTSVGRAGSI